MLVGWEFNQLGNLMKISGKARIKSFLIEVNASFLPLQKQHQLNCFKWTSFELPSNPLSPHQYSNLCLNTELCNYLRKKILQKPEKTQPYDMNINIPRLRWSFMDGAVSEHVEAREWKNKMENNNVKNFCLMCKRRKLWIWKSSRRGGEKCWLSVEITYVR
jgi:hypothetical protein